jgi:hypothetical protein
MAILIVDDNPVSAKVIDLILKKNGYARLLSIQERMLCNTQNQVYKLSLSFLIS